MSKGLDAFNNYILSRLKPSDVAFLDVRDAINQVKKELKAFDIIISKYINPHDFILYYYSHNKKWVTYEEYKRAYLDYYEDDEYMLTQEEYELVLGVLYEKEHRDKNTH